MKSKMMRAYRRMEVSEAMILEEENGFILEP